MPISETCRASSSALEPSLPNRWLRCRALEYVCVPSLAGTVSAIPLDLASMVMRSSVARFFEVASGEGLFSCSSSYFLSCVWILNPGFGASTPSMTRLRMFDARRVRMKLS